MATTLRIEHLVKRFEGLVAVNDLSIDVQERKIHALIGPNGSGKTTTLNLINSVIPPTSGQIWFRDTLLTGKPTFETAFLVILHKILSCFSTSFLRHSRFLNRNRRVNMI